MRTLRTSLFLALAGALILVACGDDDRPDRDSGVITMDSGGVDAFVPGTDSGPPPDTGPDTGVAPGTCPAGPCDLLAQTGCGAGEGCYLGDTGAICAPAGTAGDAASCTNTNDCQEGFTCQGGVCRHFCCGGTDTGCPTGQSCAIQLVNMDGTPTGAGVCRLSDTCDPLEQTGCPAADEHCYPNGGDGSVICIGSTMDLTEGENCGMTANACTGGFLCVSTDMSCRAFCDVMDMDPACPSDRVCTSLGIASQPSWGVCVPM